MNTTTFDDHISELLGLDATPAWPPLGFTPPVWDHPATSWTWALLAHGKQLPYETPHFPDHLVVQDIGHRSVIQRVVLVGIHMFSRSERPPMTHIPRVGNGDAWGGVIELDGRDLLTQSGRYANGDDGRGAAVVSYAATSGALAVTFAAAVTVTEGTSIRRYAVDRYGGRVPGSFEAWVVENGEVRRAG